MRDGLIAMSRLYICSEAEKFNDVQQGDGCLPLYQEEKEGRPNLMMIRFAMDRCRS